MTTRSKKLTLMGATEVAEFLKVSRQRVLELRKDHAEFPQPIEQLRSGPVWDKSDIESFLASWDRTPGRPRKYPPAIPPINQAQVTSSDEDEVTSVDSEPESASPEPEDIPEPEESPSEPDHEPVPDIPQQPHHEPEQPAFPEHTETHAEELLHPDNR